MAIAAPATASSPPPSCWAKGLTPCKLRGLQRISNSNGTLIMVAFDQNSSMIEMASKALKSKGLLDRDPSYDEIVEAKLDMMRQMASRSAWPS